MRKHIRKDRKERDDKIINTDFLYFKVISINYYDDISSHKRRMATCVCNSCRKTFIKRVDSLKNAKGCEACGKSFGGRTRILPNYNAAKNLIYNSYKNNAVSRGLKFELSKSYFIKLASQPCYYCGEPPREANYLSKATKKTGGFKINGVDRLINIKGYTKRNSVSCCTTCNMMKKTLNERQFIEHISKIYLYING